MNHRRLKEILNPIKESLNSVEPKQIEISNLIIARASLVATILLGIIGVSIAWWYGRLTVSLQKDQNKTSLDIAHFNQLLDKTDTIITALDSQLKLSVFEQRIANENIKSQATINEDRLLNAVFDLEMVEQNGDLEFYTKKKPSNNRDSVINSFVDQYLFILRGQLDNPAIIKDIDILTAWRKTYGRIENYYAMRSSMFHFEDSTKAQEFRRCRLYVAYLAQTVRLYISQKRNKNDVFIKINNKDFKIKTFKDALKANGLKDIDDCSGY